MADTRVSHSGEHMNTCHTLFGHLCLLANLYKILTSILSLINKYFLKLDARETAIKSAASYLNSGTCEVIQNVTKDDCIPRSLLLACINCCSSHAMDQ